jgi:protein involved in polysaccharide export with SLBB domain
MQARLSTYRDGMYRTLWVVLLTLALSPGVLLSQQSSEPGSDRSGVALSPGDQVRITVWRQPELSGDVNVLGDGTLGHPLYRNLYVAGIPIELVESRLRDYLSRYEADPQIVVEPLLRVVVGGEVRQPNLYSLPPEVTIAQAVALAGGPTERGRLDLVRLLRDGQVYVLDLTSPSSRAESIPIRSGDRIVVERRGESFFRAYVVPASSVLAAAAGLVSIFLR